MRRKVIAGNWKMYKTPSDTNKYIEDFKNLVANTKNEVIICAPYIDLFTLLEETKGTNIKVGAQNMHYENEGAYTGEISGNMLKEIGVEYVIIGHSERRAYYNETDENINKKLKKAFEIGIKPILCVGETLEQREQGITKELITKQVEVALSGISMEEIKKLIVAYEPIWAIGTGKTASKEDANEAIIWIREKLNEIYGEVSNDIIIQYGGSVKPQNAGDIFNMSDIDGGLVGGASLNPVDFSKIVNYND